MFAGLNARCQRYVNLRGTVLDGGTKEPLVGASIRISGSTAGTLSDGSGQFNLNVPNTSLRDTLIVTYVGFKKYAESLSKLIDKANVEITLTSEATTLGEVIVHSAFWKKQYSPAQLREDYTKFCAIMEKVHTGLFDYLTRRQWEALRDSSLQLLTSPMSHSEFYRLIALHVGKVRNKHTAHGVTDWWYRQEQKIWPFIPADGFNTTGKAAALNDYFPWYFSLFVEEGTEYDIKLKNLNGDEVEVTTPGLRDSFRHLSLQQVWRWRRPALELNIDDGLKSAYFRIEDSHMFKDSLGIFFKRIHDRGVQDLIIDLRGGGGIREEEQMAELYSYLITRPSRVYESIRVKSNDSGLFDKDFTYKPYAKSLKQIKDKYLDRLVDSGDGYFLWQEESYLGLIEPAKLQFTGQVYILTDGRNYSASTDFTSIASHLPNVFIVGEETGGEYRSYISGAMFGLVLPNSKIGVKIPTWKTVLAIEEDESNRGRGVMPDYPVSVSLDDFISGTDVVKEFAYKLIESGRQ